MATSSAIAAISTASSAVMHSVHKRIDGNKLASDLLAEVRDGVAALLHSGWSIRPSLVSISFVHEDKAKQEAQDRYVRNQRKAAEKAGIQFSEKLLTVDCSKAEIMQVVRSVNRDPTTTGLIMQRPVPVHLSLREIQEAIHPLKDVEGMHPTSIGNVLYGDFELAPCTAKAAVHCLKSTALGKNGLKGLECVVIGHSEIVGKPISFLLMNEGATVTTCHHMTRNLEVHTKRADAVFIAVGKAKLLHGRNLKPGAAVIDVGINPGENGGIVGDADFESCLDVCGWITPVPKGVGPVTTAILMQNTLRAANRQKQMYEKTYNSI